MSKGIKGLFIIACILIFNIALANERENLGIRVDFEGKAEKVIDRAKSTITYRFRTKDGKLINVHTPYESPKTGSRYKISGILYSDYETGSSFISEKTREIVINDPTLEPIAGKTYKDVSEINKNLIKLFHDIDQYKKEFVEVSGTVTRHYRESNWYQIKGKYGTTLDIQGFNEVPVVNSDIRKVGVLYVNSKGTPFLSELPEIKIVNSTIMRNDDSANDWLLWSLLGVLFIFGTAVAITTYVKKIKNQEPDILTDINDEPVKYEDVDDTLILSTPSKTAKILPGRITIVSEAHDKGETFPISGTPVHDGFTATVGKSNSCDITIANREEYSTVSREHAMFIFKDNQMWIQNLSKTNPTVINGNQLGDEVVPLKDGDRVRMGLLELLFETFG